MSNGKRPKPVKPVVKPPKREPQPLWPAISRWWTETAVPAWRRWEDYRAREYYPTVGERYPLLQEPYGEEAMPTQGWDFGQGDGGATGYAGGSPWMPGDISQTQWGRQYGPYAYGEWFPTLEAQTGQGDITEQLAFLSQQNRARLGQLTAQQQAGAGAPQQWAGGAGGGRAPSTPDLGGLINLATPEWWGEFERVHGMTPPDYYGEGYRGMGWRNSVNIDLAWAESMRRRNVRTGVGNVGPSLGEWVMHAYEVLGGRKPTIKEIRHQEAEQMRHLGWI